MKQVLLDTRGNLRVQEVPAPIARPGWVLVRTAYSLISSGTETATIRHQSSPLISRVAAKPALAGDLAKKALKEGVGSTFDSLQERLTRTHAIGYSLSGVVEEVGDGVEGLSPGDPVVCSGADFAHHAEVVSVPRPMVVRMPANVDSNSAAFAPVAAIAMQAVRRSGAGLGETVAVIGLGLVGLLTCQLLRRAGCTVIGMDPNRPRAAASLKSGASVSVSDEAAAQQAVTSATAGLGADAVVICAATASDDPVNLSAALCRERGRVVVVGDVGLGANREDFYRKELDLVMSRSLGPGRYDPAYEVAGVDYPPAYVRWTEQRNVAACLALMADGELTSEPLNAAEMALDDAPAAYARLAEDDQTTAVLLKHGNAGEKLKRTDRRIEMPSAAPLKSGTIGAAVIGSGEFARAVVLPALGKSREFDLRGVASLHGHTSTHAAERFGAAYATTDPGQVLTDDSVAAVWITTTHESHAELAIAALQAGKHVFLEKPIALTLEDAQSVVGAATTEQVLTVGFNRRFAPASRIVAEHVRAVSGQKQISYRVRGDALPDGHWLDDPERGGGRLLGEGVHFLDWMAWLLGEEPVRVHATGASGGPVQVLTEFADGSQGTLVYTTSGAPGTPKERVEVLADGLTAVVNDFASVTLISGTSRAKTLRAPGKGHAEQLAAFASALRTGERATPDASDGARATTWALAALESIRTRQPQDLESTFWRNA
jgi:predicted dehydrogenase/threonine dehydrogenase-like Zn-dependent dehydrogenase